jgi:hypothetical protein
MVDHIDDILGLSPKSENDRRFTALHSNRSPPYIFAALTAVFDFQFTNISQTKMSTVNIKPMFIAGAGIDGLALAQGLHKASISIHFVRLD